MTKGEFILKFENVIGWLWALYFLYYFASKYFVGGFTGFSWDYLFSVIYVVGLTFIIPAMISRTALLKTDGIIKLGVLLILPIGLTMLGLSTYFYFFIAPNYETIKLPAIIYRAIEPGVVITVLLFVGMKLKSRASSAAEQA